VRSVAGQGTVFVIDLPVTASLVKALIFGVDSELYAVPASFVIDSIEVREESMYEINQVLLCPWRGDFLRAIDAGDLLGCAGLAQKWTRPYGIIVEAAAKRCALLVDWLVGVQEIVVKPLGRVPAQLARAVGPDHLGSGARGAHPGLRRGVAASLGADRDSPAHRPVGRKPPREHQPCHLMNTRVV
jgi:two-component system chemotaxis sensor kinase CheA